LRAIEKEFPDGVVVNAYMRGHRITKIYGEEQVGGEGPPEKAYPVREMAVAPRSVAHTAEPLPVPGEKGSPEKVHDEEHQASSGSQLPWERPYHFKLGLFYQEQGDFDEAIAHYEQVIQADPSNLEAHNNLGIVYKEMGDLDKAIGQFKRALSIDPRYVKGYNNLGVAYYVKGNVKGAVSAYERALGLDPDNVESYVNLGLVYKSVNRLDKAKMILKQCLKRNDGIPAIHYNLALIYDQEENLAEAASHYRRFVELSPAGNSRLVEKVRDRVNLIEEGRRRAVVR
jgi:Tfp pilus assembly protein PilF